MPRLIVNETVCTCCGLCAAACPLSIIRLPDGELPRYADTGAERCIVCGHCEAVCPSAAITIDDPRLDSTGYSDCEPLLAADQLGMYLRMRRSIRRYRETPVDRVLIDQMLDIVRYAPTGANSQEIKWLVIYDTGELRRLTGLVVDWMRHMATINGPITACFNFEGMVKAWEKGHDPVCRQAPHLLIAYVPESALTAKTDAVIALSHLEIVAPSFGIGACWGGFFQFAVSGWEPLRAALNLPDDHVPVYAMMLGYPAFRYRRPPRRNPLSVVWR